MNNEIEEIFDLSSEELENNIDTTLKDKIKTILKDNFDVFLDALIEEEQNNLNDLMEKNPEELLKGELLTQYRVIDDLIGYKTKKQLSKDEENNLE